MPFFLVFIGNANLSARLVFTLRISRSTAHLARNTYCVALDEGVNEESGSSPLRNRATVWYEWKEVRQLHPQCHSIYLQDKETRASRLLLSISIRKTRYTSILARLVWDECLKDESIISERSLICLAYSYAR